MSISGAPFGSGHATTYELTIKNRDRLTRVDLELGFICHKGRAVTPFYLVPSFCLYIKRPITRYHQGVHK